MRHTVSIVRKQHPLWALCAYRSFLVLYVLLLLHFPACAGQDDDRARQHSEIGMAFARQRDWAAAEGELSQAVELQPTVALYYAQLASIQGLQAKWTEARRNFARAVELDPANVDFRREAAAVEWQQGQLDDAERNLRYLLDRKPDDAGAVLLSGLVNEAKGNFAEAARQLDSQFERTMADPTFATKFCNSAMRGGMPEGNVRRIVKMLEARAADPAWNSAIATCSAIASDVGNTAIAETLFSFVHSNSAARFTAGYGLALRYYRSGRWGDTERLLQDLFDSGWTSADGHRLLAFCYRAGGQPASAREEMERALQIAPTDLSLFADYIGIETSLRNVGNAELLRTRMVTAFPRSSAAWILKGNSELRSGLNKQAIASYKTAQKLTSAGPEAYLGAADAYYLGGDREQALSECRLATDKFPRDAKGFLACAKILLDSPEAAVSAREAETLLARAAQEDPNSAATHYLLGRLALVRGQTKQAEEELRKSIALDPERSDSHFTLSNLYRRSNRSVEAAAEFARFQKLKEAEDQKLLAPPAEKRE
jgi:tetratricopeptide (TPR) repeat protein